MKKMYISSLDTYPHWSLNESSWRKRRMLTSTWVLLLLRCFFDLLNVWKIKSRRSVNVQVTAVEVKMLSLMHRVLNLYCLVSNHVMIKTKYVASCFVHADETPRLTESYIYKLLMIRSKLKKRQLKGKFQVNYERFNLLVMARVTQLETTNFLRSSISVKVYLPL